MLRVLRSAARLLFFAALVVTVVIQPAGLRRTPVSRVERQSRVVIANPSGALPRLVFAPFEAAPGIPGLDRLAGLAGDVLRADLAFEGAFDLFPGASSTDGRQEQEADAVVSGLVRREDGTLRLQVRVTETRGRRLAFAREYVGPERAVRLMAHVAADEILSDQAGIQGLAHSRLAFVSDRIGGFNEPTGSRRRVKEIFVADYDGAGEVRMTADWDLALTPNWSPDRTAIAYTGYRRGYQEVFVTRLDSARQQTPTGGRGRNWLPAWSPDGTRIAFTSDRGGSADIYVMDADGTDVRRLTAHWGIDTSPAWAPDGARIAFTSNRTGRPQIWVMNADGSAQRALTTERYCDRPSWSPGPVDEIAYVSLTKTGFDIKVIELATGTARQLTSGAQNESPSFSPNGRHIAFASRRSGTQQIWTMTRMGASLRQVTRVGNNSMPSWSR